MTIEYDRELEFQDGPNLETTKNSFGLRRVQGLTHPTLLEQYNGKGYYTHVINMQSQASNVELKFTSRDLVGFALYLLEFGLDTGNLSEHEKANIQLDLMNRFNLINLAEEKG